MIVTFDKKYLEELYVDGKTTNKHYRFQPDIVSRYIKVINIMKNAGNINDIKRLSGLHYEQLVGDKNGLSSVRVNNKSSGVYRNDRRRTNNSHNLQHN